jgi:bifunctional UDP-N-acetylglucosamine pyrophosphorylase/glucosamine-1-phosphate N-acetyltransferase
MKSAMPKVLHQVCNQPMLSYVFDACRQAGCRKLIGVIGFGADQIRAAYAGAPDIVWVEQTQQLGTGHAVSVCREQLAGMSGEVLVLAGDGPLVQSQTLAQLLETHREHKSACTLATSIMTDPAAYGRIIRDGSDQLAAIVEALDATPAQRQIKEVNVSLYCFDAAKLLEVIGLLKNDNAKGEYYLTDVLGLLRGKGYRLEAVPAVPEEDVLSINDRVQLAGVNRVMQQRIQRGHMLAGVTIEDPLTTWIDPRASIGPDTIVRPMTMLDGACRVGAGCRIGPMVRLDAQALADKQEVRHG